MINEDEFKNDIYNIFFVNMKLSGRVVKVPYLLDH